MQEVYLRIGGANLQLNLADPSARLEDIYLPFRTPAVTPEYIWHVHPGLNPGTLDSLPSPPGQAFTWKVIRQDSRRVFLLRWKADSPTFWKKAVMEEDCSRGDIWIERWSRAVTWFPLPCLDLMLFSHLLLHRQGLVAHAAAAKFDGGTFIFPAPAGGGKSTWAELVGRAAGPAALGEDKVIVRRTGSGFHLFGTPWNPRTEFRKADSGPLRGIFFIYHCRRNQIQSIDRVSALRQLLQQIFLPFNQGKDLDQAVSAAEAIIQETPAYSFGFRPDLSAANYFLDFIRSHP